jgi:hypothetical protein
MNRPLLRINAALILLFALTIPHTAALAAEDADVPDAPWGDLHQLAGEWHGELDGPLGRGTGQRRYRFIFDNNFLLGKHVSTTPPLHEAAAGEVHRELSIFSVDVEQDQVILRQFLVEGFVIDFSCESAAKKLVCTSRVVENGDGMRARTTFEFIDRFRFSETFELAQPKEELRVFVESQWLRTVSLDE